jgi:outer membrane protein TolC
VRAFAAIRVRRPICCTAAIAAVSCFCAFCFCAAPAAAQISLPSTVGLAIRNSDSVRIATANLDRAAAALLEARNVYIPNFVLGSALGPPSYGFPQGQPSIYDVTSQSLIFSYAQRDYVRAARSSLRAAQLNVKDSQDQVAFDAAMAYIQLNHDTGEIAALDQEKGYAEKLVSIEEDRLAAGVDNRMEVTKAELTSAQVDVKRLHLDGDADLQRQKLSHLTGMPPSSFETQAASIPAAPEIALDSSPSDTTADNAGIQAAYANAQSKQEIAFGDARQNYRPQLAFGMEYSRFAEFNNYQDYYRNFQHNNFGAAIQITIPLFDASRRAKQRESAAEARSASLEADQTKDQAGEQVNSLRHGIAELVAQRRVAKLQSEYSQEQLAAVQTELQSGGGSPNAAPVSPKDEQQARIEERERYQDSLDADLALTRAELGLLRATGQILAWINSAHP